MSLSAHPLRTPAEAHPAASSFGDPLLGKWPFEESASHAPQPGPHLVPSVTESCRICLPNAWPHWPPPAPSQSPLTLTCRAPPPYSGLCSFQTTSTQQAA